jgi:hypothetical protein
MENSADSLASGSRGTAVSSRAVPVAPTWICLRARCRRLRDETTIPLRVVQHYRRGQEVPRPQTLAF